MGEVVLNRWHRVFGLFTGAAGRDLPLSEGALRWRVGRGRADLLVVLILTGLAYALASWLEVGELFSGWAAGHERWQADELPFTLIVLCAGLLWYGWRRGQEATAMRRRNQELARHLMQVQERERRRLARELHDELGQRCAAIRFEAQCILRGVAEGAPSVNGNPLAASARAIADSAEALHVGVRSLLRQLRPSALDTLGLDAALDELVRDWQHSHRIAVERRGKVPSGIDESLAIAVFRIVQESLTNIARHAQATRVLLTVELCADGLRVEVDDNGVGFGGAAAGFGITGMHERVIDLGGALEFASADDGGARVSLLLPLAPQLDVGWR